MFLFCKVCRGFKRKKSNVKETISFSCLDTSTFLSEKSQKSGAIQPNYCHIPMKVTKNVEKHEINKCLNISQWRADEMA